MSSIFIQIFMRINKNDGTSSATVHYNCQLLGEFILICNRNGKYEDHLMTPELKIEIDQSSNEDIYFLLSSNSIDITKLKYAQSCKPNSNMKKFLSGETFINDF